MQLGQELRAARKRAGLSTEQVADRTKIQPHKIEALEEGNYEPLPHGIYLDGIVSAYAREVGIDPAPLIERARTEQAQFVADWSASQPGLDVFHSEDTAASAAPEPEPTPSAVQPAPTPPPPASPAPAVTAPDYGDLLNADPADDLRGSTADNSTPASPSPPYDPPARSRGARKLALPILALIAIAGWAAYFYEATRVGDSGHNRDVAASTSQQDHVDNVARSEPPIAAPIAPHDSAIDRQPKAAPDNSTSTAGMNQMPPAATVEPPSAEPRAAEPSRQDDTRARTGVPDAEVAIRPDAAEPVPAAAPANDVTGVWKLATHIESSSYARYAGLVLGYELALKQDGNRVTGEGRKIEENGGGIGTRAQTPISVAGTIDGDRLTLTFTENGTRRSTEGKFVLLVEEPDTLRGRFSSTAAQSSGTVEAHRMQ